MEKQFEQLMLYYNQLKEMAVQISVKIKKESYNDALTMLNNRKRVVREMGLIERYLELNPKQKKVVEDIKKEIMEIEAKNIQKLQTDMEDVKYELDIVSAKVKFINKYNPYEAEQATGNVINIKDNEA